MADLNRNDELLLQECLDSILAGKASLETILEMMPQRANVLRPRLEAALWLQGQAKRLNPPPALIGKTRQVVLAHIRMTDTERGKGRSRAPSRYSDCVKNLFGKQKLVGRVLVTLLVGFVLLASLSGVAWASQTALPGEPFYTVKISLEQTLLAINPSDAGDARLHIRYAERRIQEIQQLATNDAYIKLSDPLRNYENHIEQALRLIHAVSRSDSMNGKSLAQALRQTLSGEIEQLNAMAQVAPESVRSNLEGALQVSEAGLIAANQVIEQLEASGKPPTPTRNTPPPIQTRWEATANGANQNENSHHPPTLSETALPPGQAKKTEISPSAEASAQTPTLRTVNTHKPTPKPDFTKKPSKTPKPTKTPKN